MRLALGLLLVATFASTASGHTGLTQTTPADGASLRAAPFSLSLGFGQPIVSVERVAVIGPSRSDLQRGARRDPRDAARVIVPVDPDGGGDYRVEWAVVAGDGHTIGGSYAFTARRGSVARPLAVIERSLGNTARALQTSATQPASVVRK